MGRLALADGDEASSTLKGAENPLQDFATPAQHAILFEKLNLYGIPHAQALTDESYALLRMSELDIRYTRRRFFRRLFWRNPNYNHPIKDVRSQVLLRRHSIQRTDKVCRTLGDGWLLEIVCLLGTTYFRIN